MLGLDDHADPTRLQKALELVRDLRRQSLLDLEVAAWEKSIGITLRGQSHKCD